MSDNGKNVTAAHTGHRGRMLEKIAKYGVKSLQPHELLEYLLWFTIPRKDTNPIGHKLLDTFGSIANVLNATPEALMQVDGVGKRTAEFLTSLPDVFGVYKASQTSGQAEVLNDINACIRYFRSKFDIHKYEDFYIFCLNGKNKVLKHMTISGENDLSINLDIQKFTNFINDSNVVSVLICHTHPLGQALPSKADIDTTEKLLQVCHLMNKALIDHIIFNESDHFSMGANRILDCMHRQVAIKLEPKTSKLKSSVVTPFSYLDGKVEPGVKVTFWEEQYQKMLQKSKK